MTESWSVTIPPEQEMTVVCTQQRDLHLLCGLAIVGVPARPDLPIPDDLDVRIEEVRIGDRIIYGHGDPMHQAPWPLGASLSVKLHNHHPNRSGVVRLDAICRAFGDEYFTTAWKPEFPA